MQYNALFHGIRTGTCNIMHVCIERVSPLINSGTACGRPASSAIHFYDLLARPAQLRFRTMQTNYSSNARVALTVAIIFILAGRFSNRAAKQPRRRSLRRRNSARRRHENARWNHTSRRYLSPESRRKFPVILTRTPYDKTGALGTCMRVAASGYVCVAQDVRGRFRIRR